MIPPASSSSPPDSFSDESLESRLQRARPAPLESALMERLRLARPVPQETLIAGKSTAPGGLPAAASPSRPASLRRNPFPFWKPLAAAAGLTLSAWAGWLATGPERVAKTTPPPPSAAEEETAEPGVEFLPSLESRQHLLSVKELGVVRDSRQRPVRLMSTTWLDENTYGESPGDPALRESRLRHEIVPVLLPTY